MIPNEIIEFKDSRYLDRCVRGVFDTDGCVFLDKRSSYNKPYLRIGLQMESKNLIQQIYSILLDRGINARINSDSRRIQINGVENCERFIKIIGFSNKRHLDKIKNLFHDKFLYSISVLNLWEI